MNRTTVLDICKRGREKNVAEVLITLGEKPEKYAKVRKKLHSWGFDSIVDYISELAKEITEMGLLPHINAGTLRKDELRELKKYSASMGLMLETCADVSAHNRSPDKDPELRINTMKKAGELKIPFTTGILVGIGETYEDRIQSLRKIKEMHERYGHIQEVIIQPFQPKINTPMEDTPPPSRSELLKIVSKGREIMPKMNIQVPPNLTGDIRDFIKAGANDLGGLSNITPDYINPDNSWPDIENLNSKIKKIGYKLRERLPIYPEFTKKSDFMSHEISKIVKNLSDDDGFKEAKG